MRPVVRRPLTVTILTVVLVLTGCDDGDLDQAPSPSPTITTVPETTEPPRSPGELVPTPPPATPLVPSPTAGATVSPASPTPAEVAAMSFTECEADRFVVPYPEDWNHNDATDLVDNCRIFHPDEIDLPDQPQDRELHWAASLYVDPVDWQDVQTREPLDEVIEERETTVDGQRALVTETRGTGQALLPEGEERYAYTVDLEGEILVAVTHTVGETDYERDKRVIDRMMEEIELTVVG